MVYGIKAFVATHLGNSTISLVTSIFNILNLEFIEFKPNDITAQNRKKRPKKLLSNFLGHNFHGAENRRYSPGDLSTEKVLAQFSYEKDSEIIFLFCFAFFSQYRICNETFRLALLQFPLNSIAENNWLYWDQNQTFNRCYQSSSF